MFQPPTYEQRSPAWIMPLIAAGIVVVGDGVFMWTGTIPAAFRGVVAFYNDADDAFAAMASINPSDAPQARNITFG